MKMLNNDLSPSTGLRKMLEVLDGFAPRVPEKSLFAIAGRGHYENPLSDLLAFFLRPAEVHGLGAAFLSTLVSALGSGFDKVSFDGVEVFREYPIEGGRLDIVIRGQGWGILIETKVRAELHNDLGGYHKAVSSDFPGIKWKCLVLSPRGPDLSASPNWIWLSFREFCQSLANLPELLVQPGNGSKWSVFARELVLHMEELQGDGMNMTKEQARFVEENLLNLKEAKRLESRYSEFLVQELNQRLTAAIPGQTFGFKDVGWAFKCADITGKAWMLLLETPGQGGDGTRSRFYAGSWTSSKHKLEKIMQSHPDLAEAQLSPEDGGYYLGRFFDNTQVDVRESALQYLERLAVVLFDAISNGKDPVGSDF